MVLRLTLQPPLQQFPALLLPLSSMQTLNMLSRQHQLLIPTPPILIHLVPTTDGHVDQSLQHLSPIPVPLVLVRLVANMRDRTARNSRRR
jgi:hypothetical protein